MADDRPSIASAIWGAQGPINGGPSDPRTRAIIDAGIARPSGDTPSTVTGMVPTPVPTAPTDRIVEEPRLFNPGAYTPPEGQSLDPALLSEFSTAAQELGLDQRDGERLLALHQKAITASEDAYAKRLQDGVEALTRELPQQGIEDARAMIDNPALTPPELKPWLAQWGNHPLLARMLVQWAQAVRIGRTH